MKACEYTQGHILACFFHFGGCLLMNPCTSLEKGLRDGTKHVLTVNVHRDLLCALHAFLSASVFLLNFFFFKAWHITMTALQ